MARIRLESGAVVCDRAVLAVTMWPRTKGLLGRASLADDEGMWIQPTNSPSAVGARNSRSVSATNGA